MITNQDDSDQKKKVSKRKCNVCLLTWGRECKFIPTRISLDPENGDAPPVSRNWVCAGIPINIEKEVVPANDCTY